MREHKQGQPTRDTEVRNDQDAHGRPPVGEGESSAAPERRRRIRRLFQVGPYIVEANLIDRSSC